MASYTNLFIDLGSSFQSTLTLRNDDGSPMDLTGYVVRGQLRRSIIAEAKIDLTVAIDNDPTTGIITISLEDEVTAAMKPYGYYLFDIEIESSGGEVTRVLKGKVITDPEITR